MILYLSAAYNAMILRYLKDSCRRLPQLLESQDSTTRLKEVARLVRLSYYFVPLTLTFLVLSKLDDGRGEARHTDTSRIKTTILQEFGIQPPLDPKAKHTWGFHHPRTGTLLTPIEMDFDDPE